MCIPASSSRSDNPALALSPSSSSSSIDSLQSLSPPCPSAVDTDATVESNHTSLCSNNSWGALNFAVACFLWVVLLPVLFSSVWSNVHSRLHQMPTALCSSSNKGDETSCAAATIEAEESDSSSKISHRGKVVGANVKAAELAAIYHSIKSEYAALASTRPWQLLSSHADGSEVSLLQHPTDPSCPYVRMTAIMPGTVQDVWDYLDLNNWDTALPKIDPYYDGHEVFGDYEHRGLQMTLARKKTKRLVTFGKRDFTFLSVSERPRDGAWVSGTVSVATARMPKEQGYVRAYQDSVSYYEALEPDNNTGVSRMRMSMLFRLDLNEARSGRGGGHVPMWIYVKTAGTTAMASVQNMKRQLELHAKEKGSSEKDEKLCDKHWLNRIRKGTTKC